MSQDPPEVSHSRAPFPVEKYWEDLRPGREARTPIANPDPNLVARHAVLKTAARVMGTPMPDGLIVEIEQVQEIVAPLRLNEPNSLAQMLFEIAGRYRRPLHQQFFGTSARQVKSHLARLLKAAQRLDELLDNTAPGLFDAIEDSHGAVEAHWGRQPNLSVSGVSIQMTFLIQAICWLESNIEIASNRPTVGMRSSALLSASEAIEYATSRPIETSWAKSGTDRKNGLKGDDGAALLAFMRLLEPKVSEARLAIDLRAARLEPVAPVSSEKLPSIP